MAFATLSLRRQAHAGALRREAVDPTSGEWPSRAGFPPPRGVGCSSTGVMRLRSDATGSPGAGVVSDPLSCRHGIRYRVVSVILPAGPTNDDIDSATAADGAEETERHRKSSPGTSSDTTVLPISGEIDTTIRVLPDADAGTP